MENPIRVLHVFGIMDRGGAETMIMNLYRTIDRQKFQFDFVVHRSEKGAFDAEIKKLGGHIFICPRYTIKNHFKYKKWWNDFFISHTEYKIVHSHVRSTASLYLKIAKNYGLKTIAHSHSISNGKGFASFIKKIYQCQISKYSDTLLACSLNAGKWLFGSLGVKSAKFHILKNALDLKRYVFDEKMRECIREKLGIDNNFVFIHIGRFHESKNHIFLIKLFKQILFEKENSVLLLVGDGPTRKSVEKKIKKLGIEEKVFFIGVTNSPENYLNAADCFLFPSKWEGLGLSAVEAQTNGLKCICSLNIPLEAKITKKCYLISTKKIKEWEREAIKPDPNRFDSYNEIIKSCGYDINDTSLQLTNIYYGVLNG